MNLLSKFHPGVWGFTPSCISYTRRPHIKDARSQSVLNTTPGLPYVLFKHLQILHLRPISLLKQSIFQIYVMQCTSRYSLFEAFQFLNLTRFYLKYSLLYYKHLC